MESLWSGHFEWERVGKECVLCLVLLVMFVGGLCITPARARVTGVWHFLVPKGRGAHLSPGAELSLDDKHQAAAEPTEDMEASE